MKLRSHLALLVVVALLPVLAFGFAMLVVLGRDGQAELHESLVATANALSLAVDRELEAAIRVLSALSASAHLDTPDLRRFHDEAGRAQTQVRGWENIVLTEPGGQQLVNTREPFGAALPRSAIPGLVRQVVETRQPAVSDLFVGAVAKSPVIAIGVPVTRDGRVKYVLTSPASPVFVGHLLAQGQVPSGWLGTVIDRNKVIIARTRDAEKFIGRPASRAFAAASSRVGAEGAFTGVTLDSAPMHGGFHRSRLSGWTVGLAVPTEVLEAPLRRSLLITGGAGLALLLASLGLAFVFGRRIARPIAALADPTTLGRGGPPGGVLSRVTEVAEVAHALDISFARLAVSEEVTRKLATLGRELAGILDLAKASERIVHEVLGLIPARRAILFRLDPVAGTLVCVAGAGDGEPARWIGHTRAASAGLSGLAIAESRPVASDDIFHDPRLKTVPMAAGQLSDECHAWISVPLQSSGETLGTLVVGDTVGRAFTDEEVRLVAAFAGAAALALRNAQVFAESERRRRIAESLAEVGRAFSRSLDLDEVSRLVTEHICALLGARSAAVYRPDPESGTLVALARSASDETSFPWVLSLAAGTGTAGLAVRDRLPVVAPDVLADPRIVYSSETLAQLEAATQRAILAVPLMVQDRVVGALTVGDRTGRVFTAEEIRVAQAFADQAALSLENARLYAETERRRRMAESLAGLGRLFSQSLDPQEVGRRIADSLRELVGTRNVTIFLIEPESGQRVILTLSGDIGAGFREGVVLPVGLGASGLAIRERRPIVSRDILSDPRMVLTQEARERIERSPIRSVLSAPLVVSERVIGALSVADAAGRAFRDEEIEMVQAFADVAAIALENARLHAAALGEIAERQRIEAALRGSEARFRSLIENALDPITVLGGDHRIRYASPAVRRVLGYTPEELVGRDVMELIHPDDASAVAAILAQGAAIPGYAGSAEFRFRHKDGSWRILESVGRNLLDDPDVEGIVINSRDVTERREAQERLRQSEKVATMGQLLAGVAHELNNPLSVVMGRAELLRSTLKAGPLAEQGRKLADAAARCGRIVKNFLTLARQHPMERQSVALNVIVRDAVELLAYPLRVDDVEVLFDLEETLPPVWADPHQLHQVVVNLITNAHHAMRDTPAPRRLSLATRSDPACGRAFIEVRNTGRGIAPEVQARIFEPFFTTKPIGQGTGLGLSLCQGIVERHGGTISVESAAGAGACFTVEIPMGTAGVVREPAAGESPSLIRAGSILVVDDEADVAALLAEFLSADGHHVETAPNGTAALRKLGERAWDVILCDLRMPELDGPGFYRELARAHPGLVGRVVFLTGDALSAETRTFIDEIAQKGIPTVAKPFDFDDITRIVRQMLAALP